MKAFATHCLFLLLLTQLPAACQSPGVSVASPDKSVEVTFELKNGVPYYRISRAGKPVLRDSRMGFVLKNQAPLQDNFRIVKTTPATFDETWTQPWGEVKTIRNHYNSLVVELQERSAPSRRLNIEFRVYDDGVGFRYEMPAQSAFKDFVIMDELTEFAVAQDLDTWWIEAYADDIDSECLYKKNKVSELTAKMHTPLTVEGPGIALSFHEAALIDYPAMALFNKGNNTLKADLIPWSNGDRAVATTPKKTPWRTMQIADKATELITSYLVLNLNEPNKLGDVSWIEPGKYDGMWWGMHIKKHTWEGGPLHGATTANMKKLIDFAAANGLSATLAEGWNEGWEGNWTVEGNFNFTKPYPDYDIDEISRYAKNKGIGLIAHHETGGNIANYERQLEDAFAYCAKYDIHRLKTGYVNHAPAGEHHQSQFMVRHYQKVMETAARYKVMLDVHEPVKDTGLRRTWPNMMTREGARGNEYEAWSAGNPPSHTATLPYTRLLAGPMDFTPGIFNILFNPEGTFRVHTTLAKQLALYVVIYSPMHMVPDLPENYEGNPAFQFVKDVPTDWETTVVPEGKIGEYIITVRKDRHSSDWYMGALTNEAARVVKVRLDFLEAGKQYTAQIYQDGKDANVATNPMALEIKTQTVDNTTTLTLPLAAGGGAAIRFYEQ